MKKELLQCTVENQQNKEYLKLVLNSFIVKRCCVHYAKRIAVLFDDPNLCTINSEVIVTDSFVFINAQRFSEAIKSYISKNGFYNSVPFHRFMMRLESAYEKNEDTISDTQVLQLINPQDYTEDYNFLEIQKTAKLEKQLRDFNDSHNFTEQRIPQFVEKFKACQSSNESLKLTQDFGLEVYQAIKGFSRAYFVSTLAHFCSKDFKEKYCIELNTKALFESIQNSPDFNPKHKARLSQGLCGCSDVFESLSQAANKANS